MEDKEFYIQMTSDRLNEQCDLYPKDSIQKVKKIDGGFLQLCRDNFDVIPKNYPYKVLEKLPNTMTCPYCNNMFDWQTEFINWDNTHGCIRCFERHFIPAQALEQYKDILRKTLKGND